jgi:hypothetical protein
MADFFIWGGGGNLYISRFENKTMVYLMNAMTEFIDKHLSDNGYTNWKAGKRWIDDDEKGGKTGQRGYLIVYTNTDKYDEWRRMCVWGPIGDETSVRDGYVYRFDIKENRMRDVIDSSENIKNYTARQEPRTIIQNANELRTYMTSKFPADHAIEKNTLLVISRCIDDNAITKLISAITRNLQTNYPTMLQNPDIHDLIQQAVHAKISSALSSQPVSLTTSSDIWTAIHRLSCLLDKSVRF